MSQAKIESRRALMKKLGKLVDATAFAVPFIVVSVNEAKVAPKEDKPSRDGCKDCGYNCTGGCINICKGNCGWGCDGVAR